MRPGMPRVLSGSTDAMSEVRTKWIRSHGPPCCLTPMAERASRNIYSQCPAGGPSARCKRAHRITDRFDADSAPMRLVRSFSGRASGRRRCARARVRCSPTAAAPLRDRVTPDTTRCVRMMRGEKFLRARGFAGAAVSPRWRARDLRSASGTSRAVRLSAASPSTSWSAFTVLDDVSVVRCGVCVEELQPGALVD